MSSYSFRGRGGCFVINPIWTRIYRVAVKDNRGGRLSQPVLENYCILMELVSTMEDVQYVDGILFLRSVNYMSTQNLDFLS